MQKLPADEFVRREIFPYWKGKSLEEMEKLFKK